MRPPEPERGSSPHRSAGCRRLRPRHGPASSTAWWSGLSAPPTCRHLVSPSWNRMMSGSGTHRLKAKGRYTIGYCRPLLTQTVMICTAAASLSNRRLRSVLPSLRWSRSARSQSRSRGQADRPSRCATSCSSCVMCARSVINRSPSRQDSTRSPMPRNCAASKIAATPRSRACPAHSRNVSAIRSVSASPPATRTSAVSPKNIVAAAARTTPVRCGWSNASSRDSQSSAASDSKMSESPV